MGRKAVGPGQIAAECLRGRKHGQTSGEINKTRVDRVEIPTPKNEITSMVLTDLFSCTGDFGHAPDRNYPVPPRIRGNQSRGTTGVVASLHRH